MPTAASGGAAVLAPGNLAARIGLVRVAAAEVKQDIIVAHHVGPHAGVPGPPARRGSTVTAPGPPSR